MKRLIPDFVPYWFLAIYTLIGLLELYAELALGLGAYTPETTIGALVCIAWLDLRSRLK